MRRAAPAVAFVAALAIAGCMGGDEASIPVSALPRIVLQPSDLSGPWVQFDEGKQIRADAPPGARADAARFGRKGGWKARYRRSGSAETEGPLVVESRADLFASVGGAEEDFDAAATDLRPSLGSADRSLDAPALGDEAQAVGLGTDMPGTVRYFTIVWRSGNVIASLTANGFGGKLTFAQVLELASKQQARIARASA